MGQLMNIVMPILLLGGAIFVYSKKCDLLGMCGEGKGNEEGESTSSGEGGESSTKVETPSADEIKKDVDSKVPSGEKIAKDVNKKVGDIISKSSSGGGGGSSNCCKCRKESNGDVRCQRHGKGSWTRYKSAKKDMAGAMKICANGCNKSNYTYRSYFVDPNDVRPFYLYHRIGNVR